MDNNIKPGYAVHASEADYVAITRVVSEHNADNGQEEDNGK